MRRVVLLAILALALPIAAFCDTNVDFNASHGTLTGSNAGLQLTGSTIVAITGAYGDPTGNLGTVGFTTGALLSGSLTAGGTFSGTGSTFTVMGNGSNGVPNTVLFSGSFAGDVTLTESGTSLHNYFFTGVVSGTLADGTKVSGPVVMNFATGKGWMGEAITIGSIDTTVVTAVPEPGTLGLLGTGLLAVGGLVRRKLSKS
jgi:PEP-CTERM motif